MPERTPLSKSLRVTLGDQRWGDLVDRVTLDDLKGRARAALTDDLATDPWRMNPDGTIKVLGHDLTRDQAEAVYELVEIGCTHFESGFGIHRGLYGRNVIEQIGDWLQEAKKRTKDLPEVFRDFRALEPFVFDSRLRDPDSYRAARPESTRGGAPVDDLPGMVHDGMGGQRPLGQWLFG